MLQDVHVEGPLAAYVASSVRDLPVFARGEISLSSLGERSRCLRSVRDLAVFAQWEISLSSLGEYLESFTVYVSGFFLHVVTIVYCGDIQCYTTFLYS